jgi:hypothetical protein
MAKNEETAVMLKKPNGETVVIQNPDRLDYPDNAKPYWRIVKGGEEICTTGEVWVEKPFIEGKLVCEESVVCTGTECFHKNPHAAGEECGQFCETMNKVVRCKPYGI